MRAIEEFAAERYGDKTFAVDEFADLVDHTVQGPPQPLPCPAGRDSTSLVLHNVETITEQSVALRFVVLADRLYDKDVPIVASGKPFSELFTPEMMAGGYQKKYFRAVSRLTALAREGQTGEPAL